jgi:SAM-dependent methyltransferase
MRFIKSNGFALILTGIVAVATGCVNTRSAYSGALTTPDDEKYNAKSAEFLHKAVKGPLAPVYPMLAEQIVHEYTLKDKKGIGVDIGGGTGSLVVELCKRTPRMYWINADINPHHFAYFYRDLADNRLEHRGGAVFADVHALPFRTDYADVIVSRGTFQFWDNKEVAFREILRVLKPGGTAFIGRGLPDAMPAHQAIEVRRKHGHGPSYDIAETAEELENAMKSIGIKDYRIRIHKNPDTPEINYGIWVEFSK